jgi:glycosyltransferase involved in cell wall biosynthesis
MTQNKKLKILMVSEASFLSSGFGTYAKEILSRLHATNKYEIAEFACYGKVNDPKDHSILWRYYANAVDENDPRHKEYNNSLENQFGRWRFERVLLDFQPDVVVDVRDYWMNSYQQFSPLRPFFHWVLMPTVDSSPQQEDWIDTFLHADAIFTYSDFGRDTLLEQSNNKINYISTTSPGVDLNIFHPIPNRDNLRQSLGIAPGSFVIGSVMRNQKRKLIPELFSAVKSLINNLYQQNNDLANNIYIYLHTSYPDAGWDIPQLLKEYEIGNRVLFTYSCKSCGFFRPKLFSHPVTYCPKCGNRSLSMPNVSNGLQQENLNQVINCFDLYVQYAICEGFGMPQVEAAAAGVPIASVDYSAMSDVVRKLNGYPVRVNQYFKELETKAIRVYPDNKHLQQIITDFISLPDILKQQKRHETRKLTEEHYNWDNIAKQWENYFDHITLSGMQGKWSSNLPLMNNINNLDGDNAYDIITSAVSTHMPQHQIISSMSLLNMLKDTDYGFTLNGLQIQPYGLEQVKNSLNVMINNHNTAIQAKNNLGSLSPEDYISYAHMKDNTK